MPLNIAPYGDAADLFYPTSASLASLPTVVLLQGADVERVYYRELASTLASEGYLVVVPDHERTVLFIRGLYPEVGLIDASLAAVATESSSVGSPIFGLVDPERSGVLGHSLGGVAALEAAGAECSALLCSEGSYTPPASLKAVATYGTNRKAPGFSSIPETTTDGISVLLMQGSLDGTIDAEDTQTTWDRIAGGDKSIMLVDGGNHYSITNEQNPPGAIPDFSSATLPQEDGLDLITTWFGRFLDAKVKGDTDAQAWFEDGTSTPEAGVLLTTLQAP